MVKLKWKRFGLTLLLTVARLSTVAGWMPLMMPQKLRHGFRSGGLKGGFAVGGSQQSFRAEMMKKAHPHICGKSAACSNVEGLRMTNMPEGGELNHHDEDDSASSITIWGREISTSALALGFLVIWQSISILFHHYQDGMPFEEAFFFSVDTGLSIGYGTIPLDNDLSRIFTMIHLLVGAGAAGAFIGIFSDSMMRASEDTLANELEKVLRQSQVERIVKKRAIAGKPRFIPKQSDDEGVDARELVPVFLLLVWITMGCIYGVKVEGFEPITALYFSVTSLSTAGLQGPGMDPSTHVVPPFNSLAVSLFCLSGVPIFAAVLGQTGKLVSSKLVQARERDLLLKPIEAQEFLFASSLLINNNKIDVAEYILLQLMRLERVDVRTIEIIKREFKKIDADGDGFLTVDEITNSTSPILPVVEHLEEEGEVEEEEEGVAEDEIKREFEKLDADGDGFLSIEEIRNSTSPVFPVAVQEENDVAGGEEDSTAGTRYR